MTVASPVDCLPLKAGMDRRRIRGGKADRVYDILNGYVDGEGIPRSRPGTEEMTTLPAGATKGLVAFDGELVVFSHTAQTVDAGFRCEILNHPDTPSLLIARIHFAEPVYGALYVAAEFANGDTYHYWLQRRDAWEASTGYAEGDLVMPTVENGYAYRAHRIGTPAPVWQAGVARAAADVIEPTTANGFQYTVTDVLGASPRSGDVEPTWPTEAGAVVYEDTDVTPARTPTPGGGGDDLGDIGLPPDTEERYGNGGLTGGRLFNVVRNLTDNE